MAGMSITLASFNVNGIRARLPVLLRWLDSARPQVVCLQEIKAQEADFPWAELQNLGYRCAVWGQKSFNGVAILSQLPLEEAQKGFDDGQPDPEARFITARVAGLRLINSYVPQGRDPADPAFQAKLAYFARMEAWLAARCQPSEQVLWCGDINVAPGPLDVYDPKRLAGQVGFHPEEWAALARTMAWGLSDLFRQHHPEEKQFTFWDYRLPKSFARNLGWRIDHLLASAPLAAKCSACWVDTEPRGWDKPSDHTPVLASFDL